MDEWQQLDILASYSWLEPRSRACGTARTSSQRAFARARLSYPSCLLIGVLSYSLIDECVSLWLNESVRMRFGSSSPPAPSDLRPMPPYSVVCSSSISSASLPDDAATGAATEEYLYRINPARITNNPMMDVILNSSGGSLIARIANAIWTSGRRSVRMIQRSEAEPYLITRTMKML
jgi:hypothetical protein